MVTIAYPAVPLAAVVLMVGVRSIAHECRGVDGGVGVTAVVAGVLILVGASVLLAPAVHTSFMPLLVEPV